MRVAAMLKQPEPVSIRVASRATREQFALALEQALAERRYSNPRGSEAFLRIRGSVTGNDVALRAKEYVMPGLRSRNAPDLSVLGSINRTATGSELAGIVSAPIGRLLRWLLGGLLAVIAVVLTTAAGSIGFYGATGTAPSNVLLITTVAGLLGFIAAVVVVVFMGTVWGLILRSSQRVTLRRVGDLSRFLQLIAAEAELGSAAQSSRQKHVETRPIDPTDAAHGRHRQT